MNTCRTGLSACVVKGLPNVGDYIYKHRDLLMEEDRQRLLKELEKKWEERKQQNQDLDDVYPE